MRLRGQRQHRSTSCTLRDGLKFSNGNTLTSEDVKFSFERTLKIDDDAGPAVAALHASTRSRRPDDRTVVFKLKVPDATFPSKIASGAGSIVDHARVPRPTACAPTARRSAPAPTS